MLVATRRSSPTHDELRTIPEHIRRRYAVRADLTCQEWARRYRLVCDGPVATSGAVPWNETLFPPGRDIMDACSSGRWRRVIMLAAPQSSGKTSHAINALLYSLHWLNKDVMLVHANAARGESLYAKKIGPAIVKSDELAELIPENRDDIGTKEAHRFTNGTMFYVTGSESEADLSGATAPVILFDDVHAMPEQLGSHGHPVEFAEMRAAAFPPDERLSICCGQASDTDAWLWRKLCESTFWCLYLPCPSCGTYQLLDWDRMVFDRSSPEAAGRDCWMRCAAAECTRQIRHEDLAWMLPRYAWVSTPPGANVVMSPGERTGLSPAVSRQLSAISQTTAHRAVAQGAADSRKLKADSAESAYPDSARPAIDAGFWWNAFSWPLVPWTDHAAKYVAGMAGEKTATEDRTFRQQHRVIPIEPEKLDAEGLTEESVASHASDEATYGVIPPEADGEKNKAVVIVTCDVQAGHVWYLVLAWNRETGSSWLVEAGRYGATAGVAVAEMPDQRQREQVYRSRVGRALETLWQKVHNGWAVGEDQRGRSATVVLVDCGYLRETVQFACRRANGGSWLGRWRPYEGSTCKAAGAVPIWSDVPRIEQRTKRPYHEINVNRAKLKVREIFGVPPGAAGSHVIPADTPDQIAQWYRAHLCAEEWDETRKTWVQRSSQNHLLDCWAAQVAGAIACGVRLEGDAARLPRTGPDGDPRSGRHRTASRSPTGLSVKLPTDRPFVTRR